MPGFVMYHNLLSFSLWFPDDQGSKNAKRVLRNRSRFKFKSSLLAQLAVGWVVRQRKNLSPQGTISAARYCDLKGWALFVQRYSCD